MPSTIPTFRLPLAPLHTWAPLSAVWPDDYTPTPEEQAWRDGGIKIAYQKAVRRRTSARAYAKKHGLPMPSLDEPIEPYAVDFVAGSRPGQPPPRMKLNPPEFPWHLQRPAPYQSPEQKRRDKAKWQEMRDKARAHYLATKKAYADRDRARRLGLPLPPTVYQLEQQALKSSAPKPRGEPMSEAVIPMLLTLAMIRRFYVPLGRTTIFRMISTGAFPEASIRQGRKVRLWRREDVEAWVEAGGAE